MFARRKLMSCIMRDENSSVFQKFSLAFTKEMHHVCDVNNIPNNVEVNRLGFQDEQRAFYNN